MKKQEHINYAIKPDTHSSMYLMHKFWARKPANIVSEYIKCYTRKNDIVMDPFCGSGVTPLEAIKIDRRAIAIDIDPMATFITRMTGIPVNIELLQKEFLQIKNLVKNKIDSYYKSDCQNCGNDIIYDVVMWNDNQPTEIRYKCNCKKGSQWKKVSKNDIKLINEYENIEIPFWYPDNELIWNTRINVNRGTKISDLFTRRNLYALSLLLNKINNIDNILIKEMLRFTFSSTIPQVSKLIPYYHEEQRQKQAGGWGIRGYWIPKDRFEQNAWHCFEERFKKVLRGKNESNKFYSDIWKEAKELNDLDSSNIFINTQSACRLSGIPDDYVDYIFTDPPYGDYVPYLELNYLYSSWLGFKPSFDEEIIISDSPVRNRKSLELYSDMLQTSFEEMHRVLKINKYLNVTFHNSDINIYNSILRAANIAGFKLEKIVYQMPPRSSAKTLLAPYGSADGDYYLRFLKPSSKQKTLSIENVNNEIFENVVVESLKKILAQRGQPTSYTDILRIIYIELDKRGYLAALKTQRIEKILKNYENKDFIFIKGQGWWFKDPEKYLLHITPLSDRIETLIIQLLRKKPQLTFDDALKEIIINLPNGLTPDDKSVHEVLEEYAYQSTKGNLWSRRQNLESRIKEHSKMIGHLSLIGKKLGYKTIIGKREQGEIYEDKPLSIISDPIIEEFDKNVLMIDLLWVDNSVIHYSFEVEYSTTITESIIRASYIKLSEPCKIFVIPEERENFLYKKISSPALSDTVNKQNWKFLFFKDVNDLYNLSKSRRKLTITDFNNNLRQLSKDRYLQVELL